MSEIPYVADNGYDGLVDEGSGCDCELDGLEPCCYMTAYCQPGYKVPCDSGACGDHDFRIIAGKRPQSTGGEVSNARWQNALTLKASESLREFVNKHPLKGVSMSCHVAKEESCCLCEKAHSEHEEQTRDWMSKHEALLAALKGLSKDMHGASSRPCSTCGALTEALGEPFGCCELQELYKKATNRVSILCFGNHDAILRWRRTLSKEVADVVVHVQHEKDMRGRVVAEIRLFHGYEQTYDLFEETMKYYNHPKTISMHEWRG